MLLAAKELRSDGGLNAERQPAQDAEREYFEPYCAIDFVKCQPTRGRHRGRIRPDFGHHICDGHATFHFCWSIRTSRAYDRRDNNRCGFNLRNSTAPSTSIMLGSKESLEKETLANRHIFYFIVLFLVFLAWNWPPA